MSCDRRGYARKLLAILGILVLLIQLLSAQENDSGLKGLPISGQVEIGGGLALVRTDPLRNGFFPSEAAARFNPAGSLRLKLGNSAGNVSFAGGYDQTLTPAQIQLTDLSANFALCPEIGISFGYGMTERGEGRERAMFDAIGGGKPYPGLSITMIPSGELSLFATANAGQIAQPLAGDWYRRVEAEAGFSWTPPRLHVLGGFSRLATGKLNGGLAASLDLAGGIWILELGIQFLNPALYPTDGGQAARQDWVQPYGRLATLYTVALGEGSLAVSASLSADSSAYTPAELKIIGPGLYDLQRTEQLANTGLLHLMLAISWDDGSGSGISLSAMFNPLDQSLLLDLSGELAIGSGSLVAGIQAAGGYDPTADLRLLQPSLIISAAYRLYF